MIFVFLYVSQALYDECNKTTGYAYNLTLFYLLTLIAYPTAVGDNCNASRYFFKYDT